MALQIQKLLILNEKNTKEPLGYSISYRDVDDRYAFEKLAYFIGCYNITPSVISSVLLFLETIVPNLLMFTNNFLLKQKLFKQSSCLKILLCHFKCLS
jgi:hypothetical protein